MKICAQHRWYEPKKNLQSQLTYNKCREIFLTKGIYRMDIYRIYIEYIDIYRIRYIKNNKKYIS
jgi:hypothetical protein